MTSRNHPAGPSGRPLIGNLLDYRRDPLEFLTRCVRDYGDFVPIRLGPYDAVVVNDPADIEQVLAETNSNYGRYLLARLSGSLMGKGLFTSEGPLWQRQRKLLAPAFHRRVVSGFADIMTSTANHVVDDWQDGADIEVMAEMARITVQNVSKSLFDADVATDASDVADALTVVFDTFQARLESPYPLPEWVPTPSNRRFIRARKRLDETIYRIIRQRRRSGEQPPDVLSLLLGDQTQPDGVMTDKQLRDEVMALFIGGHEPVAGGLSFTWYLLAKYPRVAMKLREELDEVLGGRAPTVEDLSRLPYTEAVVKESLRLYPPAWAFDRKALVDCEIGGRPVRKGTLILIVQWALHRDPRRFEAPEEFRPERWQEGLAGRLPKYAFLPFGGGPRFCIGNAFAMLEMQLVVATIAQRVRLDLAPGATAVPQPSITLRPRGGIDMVVRTRASAPGPEPESRPQPAYAGTLLH
jgi:cytochrome P450